MKYITGNQMASPEGTDTFVKQKVKLESKTILGKIWSELYNIIIYLGELYIEYLFKNRNENARLQRRLYYSFDIQICQRTFPSS